MIRKNVLCRIAENVTHFARLCKEKAKLIECFYGVQTRDLEQLHIANILPVRIRCYGFCRNVTNGLLTIMTMFSTGIYYEIMCY